MKMMHFLTRSIRPVLFALFAALFVLQAHAEKRKKKEQPKPKTIYEIDTLVHPIPRQRQLFHDYLNKAIRGADASDGKVDGFIWYGDDSLASAAITQAMIHTVKHLDTMIENLPFPPEDKQAEHNAKVGYLRAVTEMVRKFNSDLHYDPYFYRKVVGNMRDAIIAKHEKRLDAFVHANTNVYMLANAQILENTPELHSYIYREVGQQEPLMMIRRLVEFAHEPFACDIIAAAARKAPKEIYNYASSTNPTLSGAIRRCKDPLVQAIVRVTTDSKSPLKAMSFISDIYNKRLTIAEVDKITADEKLLFKNLVRLKLEGDSLGGDTYTDELQYRANSIYIRSINELHESPDPVRFKILEGLTPEELYFVIVYGQDQIYTSSFIGTFNRMMERLKPNTGDELFDKVHYEHFRTFIRMCAGYGKLSEFLGTMKPDEKTAVMKDFITGLEVGKTDELEDAVDVADAFGSITDSTLAEFLRQEIVANYSRVSEKKNLKGTIVYGLLATLTKGSNSGELSQSLNLPPINVMPDKSLVNDSGIVYEQFFFYGDEDGKNSFNSFKANFVDPKKWKIEEKFGQWVEIRSVAGKPVVIYANLPLNYEEGKDDEAQKALKRVLLANNIHPTVLVHRGHSYHLGSTIDFMEKSNHIIILGSCGGYHNLGKVLDRAPDAHLISTKQTGTMVVNDAIVKYLEAHLLNGDDVDWVALWNEIGLSFKGKPGEKEFAEYVPPYRNLGAIFIKAYRRMFNEQEAAGG
jgi:hypothetical protein